MGKWTKKEEVVRGGQVYDVFQRTLENGLVEYHATKRVFDVVVEYPTKKASGYRNIITAVKAA